MMYDWMGTAPPFAINACVDGTAMIGWVAAKAVRVGARSRAAIRVQTALRNILFFTIISPLYVVKILQSLAFL